MSQLRPTPTSTPHHPQDWLFIAAKRVSCVEYCLLLATFGLVLAFGLEGGIAAGIVLAALHFAYRWDRGVGHGLRLPVCMHVVGPQSSCLPAHAPPTLPSPPCPPAATPRSP